MLLFWVDNPAVLLRGWHMQAPPDSVPRGRDEYRTDDRGDEDEQGHDHDAERAGRDES